MDCDEAERDEAECETRLRVDIRDNSLLLSPRRGRQLCTPWKRDTFAHPNARTLLSFLLTNKQTNKQGSRTKKALEALECAQALESLQNGRDLGLQALSRSSQDA